jgi:uncharacterized protein YjbI with pentapeptide repeats
MDDESNVKDLAGKGLNGTNLTGANLSGVVGSDFSGAILE